MASTNEQSTTEVAPEAVVVTETPATAQSTSAKRGKHTIADHAILVRPIITEKALLSQAQRKYMFEVAIHATKISIKKAFHNAFGFMPESVNVSVRAGKVVRHGRFTGSRKDTKLAIITLKEGQAI